MSTINQDNTKYYRDARSGNGYTVKRTSIPWQYNVFRKVTHITCLRYFVEKFVHAPLALSSVTIE